MDFYDRINKLLKEKRATKKQMCADLGISYNSLMSMFNRRSKNISIDSVTAIAEYFDVSSDYLLSGEPFKFWFSLNTEMISAFVEANKNNSDIKLCSNSSKLTAVINVESKNGL